MGWEDLRKYGKWKLDPDRAAEERTRLLDTARIQGDLEVVVDSLREYKRLCGGEGGTQIARVLGERAYTAARENLGPMVQAPLSSLEAAIETQVSEFQTATGELVELGDVRRNALERGYQWMMSEIARHTALQEDCQKAIELVNKYETTVESYRRMVFRTTPAGGPSIVDPQITIRIGDQELTRPTKRFVYIGAANAMFRELDRDLSSCPPQVLARDDNLQRFNEVIRLAERYSAALDDTAIMTRFNEVVPKYLERCKEVIAPVVAAVCGLYAVMAEDFTQRCERGEGEGLGELSSRMEELVGTYSGILGINSQTKAQWIEGLLARYFPEATTQGRIEH